MTVAVVIRHNFETAHRLFDQGRDSKCWSLHGHSFWMTLEIEAPDTDDRGMVVEYGELKQAVRGFIDTALDHGAVLNRRDPLVPVLLDQGCKVLTLNQDPTVEALAAYLGDVASMLLADMHRAPGAQVRSVTVQETQVNAAEVRWGP